MTRPPPRQPPREAAPALVISVLLAALPAAARAQPAAGPPAAPPTPARLERALVPVVGGDTDIGLGGGAIGSLARPAPGRTPFLWKLEGAVLATFKVHDGPELVAPFQDAYLSLILNGVGTSRLRLELRAAFTRETNLRYYGLGNASVDPPGGDRAARDFFTRIHPAARARGRLRLAGPVHLVLGTTYIQNWVEFQPESTLLADAREGSPRERDLLQIDTDHGLHLLEGGLVLDTRDDEVSPETGQHHQIEMRASPWKTPSLPYRYAGFSAIVRFYLPVVPAWGDRLVLATRAVGDLAIGDVPFYELSRFDETSALGGSKYVRGVPSNRYYGKRKLLGNVELRARLYEFGFRRSRYDLGFTGFLDVGRVWADVGAAPELDGRGLGLKYGLGGGLRLQKGRTFVLRADLAWSPDARPVGGYFLAGHLF